MCLPPLGPVLEAQTVTLAEHCKTNQIVVTTLVLMAANADDSFWIPSAIDLHICKQKMKLHLMTKSEQ